MLKILRKYEAADRKLIYLALLFCIMMRCGIGLERYFAFHTIVIAQAMAAMACHVMRLEIAISARRSPPSSYIRSSNEKVSIKIVGVRCIF